MWRGGDTGPSIPLVVPASRKANVIFGAAMTAWCGGTRPGKNGNDDIVQCLV